MNTVLDVINVSKSYPTTPPVHALRDASFSVTEGELKSLGSYLTVCWFEGIISPII